MGTRNMKLVTDVTLKIGTASMTWQMPEGGTARIDLFGLPGGGLTVRFYGEDAEGRILTGSMPPSTLDDR